MSTASCGGRCIIIDACGSGLKTFRDILKNENNCRDEQ